MGDIINFAARCRVANPKQKVVTKIVDGKPVEFLDVDSLSPLDREQYFSGGLNKMPRDNTPRGTPIDVTPLW